MKRELFTDEHDLFRASFRTFLEREVTPHLERWERDGIVSRELFTKAGQAGFLGMGAPEQYGGGGVTDFRYNAVIGEEVQRTGSGGAGLALTLHNDICMPYFVRLTNDEQKARWLPSICSGASITAIAMTEPSAGSDLASISTSAVRDADDYIVSGAKTFITNGINADLVVTAVKTDSSQRHRGMSLLVIEDGMPGFERGRNLEKIGLHSQDTSELFFDNVRVPTSNLLGQEGQGFTQLVGHLPQERLSIAIAGIAAAQAALDITLDYCASRNAFGARIDSFQNTRFKLVEAKTEIELGQLFVDKCVEALNAGELTPEDAAMAKWWCTELQGRVVDMCLQLHGGYGYMLEYPIARAYLDARITRIYGGTTEIMKELIAKRMTR